MSNINLENNCETLADNEIWNGLQNAIAQSSGFQRWLIEAGSKYQRLHIEQQVQKYLRETLENLAY
ncbi:MAG: hypothetical protein IGS39_14935 [Calothrix sp. C42_A2020_038]|nr:hypothetical protein [Calothrix sp. C42_A2020_038]